MITNENRIQQYLNDIQKYGEWGKMLAGQSLLQLLNSNTKFSLSVIHNGLKFIKAKMKLNVLLDTCHSEHEKEKRLKQIDIDIPLTEEIAKHDLEYRGLLIP